MVSGLCPTATLCSDCLCFDLLVHKLASSKTTVDLNKAKGMLLFHKLLEWEHSGGGGRNAGHQNSHWTDAFLPVPNRPLCTSGGNVFCIRCTCSQLWNIFIGLSLILNLLNIRLFAVLTVPMPYWFLVLILFMYFGLYLEIAVRFSTQNLNLKHKWSL